MAKPESTRASETLHEIESVFDRSAHWAAQNPRRVLGVLGVVLATAAAIGGTQAWRTRQEGAASAEVASIQADYRRAMGAQAGQGEIPEPANAEAAAATRREYATRLAEAADRLAGTPAGVTARLQAGTLQAELGEAEAALATWRRAAEDAPADSVLAALAQARLAAGLETAGDPAGAAEAYLSAAEIAEFPGRLPALGDAARCFAQAGQTERALEIFTGLSEEEVAKLPVYVTARLMELRIRTRSDAPTATSEAP